VLDYQTSGRGGGGNQCGRGGGQWQRQKKLLASGGSNRRKIPGAEPGSKKGRQAGKPGIKMREGMTTTVLDQGQSKKNGNYSMTNKGCVGEEGPGRKRSEQKCPKHKFWKKATTGPSRTKQIPPKGK